jgi:hypothetical protein
MNRRIPSTVLKLNAVEMLQDKECQSFTLLNPFIEAPAEHLSQQNVFLSITDENRAAMSNLN